MAKQKGKEESELTESQKVFCREYIFDWNATRAYQKAYPESTYEAAISSGSRLLTKAKIQKYCTDIQQDLEKLAGISRLQVITEHKKIAYSSIAHLHNTWITRKEFDELTDDQKAAIESIETSTRKIGDTPFEVETIKIKLYSKQKSLDSINKMLGYDAAQKVQISIPEKQVMYIGGNKIEF
jgi:phage terminase small subunit